MTPHKTVDAWALVITALSDHRTIPLAGKYYWLGASRGGFPVRLFATRRAAREAAKAVYPTEMRAVRVRVTIEVVR